MEAANTYRAYLHAETMRVVVPYIVIGVVALCWAITIAISRFPKIDTDATSLESAGSSFLDLCRCRHFLLAIVAQFMYVGASVGTWSYFISYVQDSAHQPEKVAGYCLTGTLAVFGIGRFFSALAMRFVEPAQLMGIYSIINVLLVGIAVAYPGWVGIWAIFSTSFFMSLMYPTIFALGIRGLGRNTKIGGALIVMAIIGGAVLTPAMGWIAQVSHRISIAYIVPLVCYCFITFYSISEQRISRRSLRE